jgi:hypothetical protein
MYVCKKNTGKNLVLRPIFRTFGGTYELEIYFTLGHHLYGVPGHLQSHGQFLDVSGHPYPAYLG